MVQETPQNWPYGNGLSQIPIYPELSEETKETNKELYELYTWSDAYTYIDLFFSFSEEAEKWVLEKQYEGHIDQHIISAVALLSHEAWREMQFHYARASYDHQTGKFVLKWPIISADEEVDESEKRQEIEYDARFFPSAK
jgi:hypothetical protein